MNSFGDIRQYDILDVSNKRVLDLGGDYGMTPLYFLSIGADLVVASEKDHARRRALHNIEYCEERLKSVGEIRRGKDIERLIHTYHIDRAKVDIEGEEKHLLDVRDPIIKKVEKWLIECHGEEMYDHIEEHFGEFHREIIVDNPKRVLALFYL